MPVLGVPAFDSVALLEIDGINFTGSGVSLVGHAAFVSSETGTTYGSTECRHWSKTTMDLLKELRSSMEVDIAALVFKPGAAAVTYGHPPAAPSGAVGGIGEHAGQPTEAEAL